MPRREFLGSAAKTMGAAALSGIAASSGAAAPVSAARREAGLPADNADGTAIFCRPDHESGIPLGGIGAGSIEIRPDGYFHDWLIFNNGGWAGGQPDHERGGGPGMPPSAFSFLLRTRQGGAEPQVRRLGVRPDQNELYSRSWVQSVEAIRYDGRFPAATLTYVDGTLPVEVTGVFFSPFTPHDARASGTPGFHAVFRVKNRSRKRVEVSLLGTLRNPLAWGAADRKLHNAVREDGGTTFLTMRTDADSPRKATLGSIGLSVTGGKSSWIAGEFEDYLSNGGWLSTRQGSTVPSFLTDFREQGRLPRLSGAETPQSLLKMNNQQIAGLQLDEKKALAERLCAYASFAAARRRVERVMGDALATPESLTTFLQECAAALNAWSGEDRARQDWGAGALCSTLTLAAGEEREIRFTLGWHFPHHFSETDAEMGHQYEAWFDDAEAVNRFLVRQYDAQRSQSLGFANAMFDTTLGTAMAMAWSAQLSTLVKCTWWTRDGRFAVWEGLGCCGFHTTDITYQGSFGILALFPELQKGQMKMGAEFQRADGRVHHFFTPDLFHVDNGFDRVDMNPQFVMLVCRDFLWTGDKQYLAAMWPHVQRAMASTALLDGDGDGLPDRDTRRNTYDQWNFSGTPAYIASLWLGALRAGVRIATEIGDDATARKWDDGLQRGMASFHKTLWNGEYYSLQVASDHRDECCMSDQLSGEWFTHLMGVGPGMPDKRVVAALTAIVRRNFTPEQGLVNASFPDARPAYFATYQNAQATANWTGIEYAVASMLIDYGLVAEGRRIVESVHQRYLRAGRIWNHTECGDHYYRAMSSWAVLLAATGFKVDASVGMLTIAPPRRQAEIRAPWVSSTAWGAMVQKPRRLDVSLHSGELALERLRVSLTGSGIRVRVNGKPVAATVAVQDGLTTLRFAAPIRLRSGDTIVVTA
ncbi:MAG TPA: GH116 family glycosyl hydrolase [Armatimonadota bacterium]|jgi:uncharacterized protein (DUF608 family)